MKKITIRSIITLIIVIAIITTIMMIKKQNTIIANDLFCRESDFLACQSDADCLCTEVNGCFMGNRTYYNACADKSIGCDDFCA